MVEAECYFSDTHNEKRKQIDEIAELLGTGKFNLVVEAHLPNFEQKDVNIEVENGALVISAERHEKEEDKGKQYVVRESSSSFYRRIALPKRADADKIEAHLNDGVLKVSVPLTPLPEPKKIAISAKKK